MNYYIDAQIKNMIALTSNFENACTLAARKDDGQISRDEEKQLKKIKAAAQRFKKDLEKLNR